MEEARYWMWAKTKPDPRLLTAAMGDSWEEQAFAEDAANTLGGCVWPPRSYSCSFCRREFRSAQALGGHMNVHRRDRARLKQSPVEGDVPRDHALNACTFLYSNPNPEFRVSPPPEEKISNLSFFPPFVKNNDHHVVSVHDPPPWSSFLSEKRDRSTKEDEKKSNGTIDLETRAEKEDCVTEDLSKSLNLVVCQKRKKATSSDDDDDEEVASCKRRKIEAKPSRCIPQSDQAMDSADELDLELRLGITQKVK